jgi:hypothetical protein
VVAELRERLSVSKQATQKLDMHRRFDLKKLNNAERNSIRSKLGTDVQLWKTWMTEVDIT